MFTLPPRFALVALATSAALAACSNGSENATGPTGNNPADLMPAPSSTAENPAVDPSASIPSTPGPGVQAPDIGEGAILEPEVECIKVTCAERGWACGKFVDNCNNVIDCADEGLGCGEDELCTGNQDGKMECRPGGGPCALCSAIPNCSAAPTVTRLEGRVMTPGRTDTDTGNQVGVPNAMVYILRSNDPAVLPPILTGIPADGTNCDRCEEQDLGPVLVSTATDATGAFALQGSIPVGVEMLLVVKSGKFRRAATFTLPESAACATTSLPTSLPDNPTRLPRDMTDGIAVNIPRIAISTGNIDAMECLFHKIGIAGTEFDNGSEATTGSRIHLYRGGTNFNHGSRVGMVDGTPDSDLYGSLARLQSYDMLVADCEGEQRDVPGFAQRDLNGGNVRDYVNRGGRMFASHWSYSWLASRPEQDPDSDLPYDPATFQRTGLGPVAVWLSSSTGNNANSNMSSNLATGALSLVGPRPQVSARIQVFADWLVNETVTTAPAYEFAIQDPRNQVESLGTHAEEFVFRSQGTNEARTQVFTANTPYGSPDEATCGRITYSGFHVAAGGANVGANVVFPDLCEGTGANEGVLTDQEKVLLYMLFDLGTCVGEDPPCLSLTCETAGVSCGFAPDNCGGLIDCGLCAIDTAR